MVKTSCMSLFQFPVNSFCHSKNDHINMLESFHPSVEVMVICTVDIVVKTGWIKPGSSFLH